MSRRRGLQQCSPGTARRVYARSAGSSTLGPWRPTARCAGCPAGGCRVCGVFFAINCFSRDFRSYYNLLPSYGSTPLTTGRPGEPRGTRIIYGLLLLWSPQPGQGDMVAGGSLQWLPARVMCGLPRWHTQRCGRCQNSRYLYGQRRALPLSSSTRSART